MEKLNYKERFLKALHREPVDRIPVPAFCSHLLTELLDHTGLSSPEIHFNLPDMVKYALAGHEVLGLEGVRLPTDGVIEAEAMGCRIDPGEVNRIPSVIEHPFSLDGVKLPDDFMEKGRIPLYLEAVKIVKDNAGNSIPVTAHFIGPTTIACHLVNSETFLLGLLENQEQVKKLLDTLTEICIQMGKALDISGADVLQFPDPMASSDIISPEIFKAFIRPCYKKIFNSISCPIVIHICGNTNPILPFLKGLGAAGFSFDVKVSVSEAKEILGDELSLVGNISTTDTLLWGSKEDIKKDTLKAIQEGINVLAPACGFAPGTPLENIREMIRTVKSSSIKDSD